jgi:hypothetical protein
MKIMIYLSYQQLKHVLIVDIDLLIIMVMNAIISVQQIHQREEDVLIAMLTTVIDVYQLKLKIYVIVVVLQAVDVDTGVTSVIQ